MSRIKLEALGELGDEPPLLHQRGELICATFFNRLEIAHADLRTLADFLQRDPLGLAYGPEQGAGKVGLRRNGGRGRSWRFRQIQFRFRRLLRVRRREHGELVRTTARRIQQHIVSFFDPCP